MTRPLQGILGKGVKVFPQDLLDGGGSGPMVKKDGNYWFVDGDAGGDGGGRSWQDPKKLIQSAITASIDSSAITDPIYANFFNATEPVVKSIIWTFNEITAAPSNVSCTGTIS